MATKKPAFKLPKSKCVKRYARKSSFDKRSFRYTKRGKLILLIGCPKGKWNAKTKRCKVGTRAFEAIKAAKRNRCPNDAVLMRSF